MGRRRVSKLSIGLAGGLTTVHTAFAGASLLIEAYRQAGIGEQADRVLPQKRSPKGLTPGQMVECVVVGSALGIECLEDMERLRQDQGLSGMLGYQPPARRRPASGWTGSTRRRWWRTVLSKGPSCPWSPPAWRAWAR